jgi:hypothetical protein
MFGEDLVMQRATAHTRKAGWIGRDQEHIAWAE